MMMSNFWEHFSCQIITETIGLDDLNLHMLFMCFAVSHSSQRYKLRVRKLLLIIDSLAF